MRYLCLVHVDDPAVTQMLDEEQGRQLDIDSLAYDDELAASGNFVTANALQPPETAALVRVRDGQVSVTDGPFIETKEQLAGFLLIEARDLNDAIRLASGVPMARYGTIEVRGIYEIPVHDQPRG